MGDTPNSPCRRISPAPLVVDEVSSMLFNPLYPPIMGEDEKKLGDTPNTPAGELLLHL